MPFYTLNMKNTSAPVSYDHIDELVHGGVLAEEHLRVVDLILAQDHPDLIIRI